MNFSITFEVKSCFQSRKKNVSSSVKAHITPVPGYIAHIFFFPLFLNLVLSTWGYWSKKSNNKKRKNNSNNERIAKILSFTAVGENGTTIESKPTTTRNQLCKKKTYPPYSPPLPPLEYFWCKILNIFSIKSWTALGNGGMVERVKALANSRFRWIIIPVHLDSLLSAIHIVSYWTKRKQIRHDKDLNYCPNKKKIIR